VNAFIASFSQRQSQTTIYGLLSRNTPLGFVNINYVATARKRVKNKLGIHISPLHRKNVFIISNSIYTVLVTEAHPIMRNKILKYAKMGYQII